MDKAILDDKESSKKFAHFFHSAFTYDDCQTTKLDDYQLNSKLSDIVFNTYEIIIALKNYSDSLSLGPDSLSAYFLKRICSSIALPLSIIYQKSFNTVTLPNVWKTVTVIPVYKGKALNSK